MKTSNKPTLLARLFGRSSSASPLVSTLYTHALGRPLLVHPSMGEQLIGAYLSGAVAGPGDTEEYVEPTTPLEEEVETSSRVAVLNVNGGLCARPMPGPCDDGPLSYESLGEAIDRLAADETVSAIFLRIDSPGGMASNLFDLTDRIYAARASKPVWAIVDDMAYSAAYAIAAACERIFVSRTGGVGSVGVVAYHVDQSQADINAGIKVTPIFSGSHKVDFSPHAPLSDEAKAREQAAVDSLYDLFCSSVATYRGLTPEAVKATEALTYQGQACIDVGFATDLGTFADALVALSAPVAEDAPAEEDVPVEEDAPAEDVPAEDVPAEEPQDEESAKAALETAVKTMAVKTSIKLSAKVQEAVLKVLTSETAVGKLAKVAGAVSLARSVSSLCEVAGKPDMAVSFVESSATLEDVRSKLLEARALEDEAVQVAAELDPKTVATEPHRVELSAAKIYAARKALTNKHKTKE